MRFSVTATVLVYASCAIAQTTSGDASIQKPMAMRPAPSQRPRIRQAASPGAVFPNGAKAAAVPPGTPVVTLQGVCKDRQAKTPCETVITREDLDRYVGSSTPDVSKMARARQAVQYARTLAFSALAEQQGLARDPAVAKELEDQQELVRARILANAFVQKLQTQAPSVAEADVQKYYKEHREQYEQVEVRRLAVPIEVPTESGLHLDRAAAKSEMGELRNRAVAGEDLDQLQQDAYKHLHIQATPPPVSVQTLRRGTVQGDEAKLFDLNPGEISAVLDLPAAFAIVKIESKDPMPIETVRAEIEAALRRDSLQSAVGKRTKDISAQFNLQYLEMPSQPEIFGVTAIGAAPNRASIRTAPTNLR